MSKTTAMKRPPLDDSNYAAWFWHRQSVADRIRALDNIEQNVEVAFAPFFNDQIVKGLLRWREHLGDAIDMWEQYQFERAEIFCVQAEGTLIELKTLAREAGIPGSPFIDRMLQ